MATRKSAKKTNNEIKLPAFNIQRFRVTVKGKTPLITHNWGHKAIQQMADKQQKKAKGAKQAKDPAADFEEAKYLNAAGEDCVRAAFFKNAFVSAARYADNIKMTVLRGAVFFVGDLLPIKYDECVMREDTVRVGMGTADLRYRPEYRNWSVDLEVEYNADVLTAEQVMHLIQLSGFSVGICEWRPEKNGDFGRFGIEAAA